MPAGRDTASAADEVLVARSAPMRRLLELVDRVAPADAVVRIAGETGTGKGMVARELHRRGPRAGLPFVQISCANLPDTLFESEMFGYEKGSHTDAAAGRRGRLEEAGAGTVLLDGVGELSPAAQGKLLRVVQERSFEPLGGGRTVRLEARLLATSGGRLEEAVHAGTFRDDLFYRLDVVRLEMPPLRDRREDIPLLATMFLRHYRRRHRRPLRVLTRQARRALTAYSWPGNVRELRNTMERAVLAAEGRDVDVDLLRLGEGAPVGSLAEEAAHSLPTLAELEAEYIRRVLAETRGNQTRAAAILGISRKALRDKRRRHGLP